MVLILLQNVPAFANVPFKDLLLKLCRQNKIKKVEMNEYAIVSTGSISLPSPGQVWMRLLPC